MFWNRRYRILLQTSLVWFCTVSIGVNPILATDFRCGCDEVKLDTPSKASTATNRRSCCAPKVTVDSCCTPKRQSCCNTDNKTRPSCLCKAANKTCECTDCQCAVTKNKLPVPPAIPPVNESSSATTLSLINHSYPQNLVPNSVVCYCSQVNSFLYCGTAQETCAHLSRFTC